MRAIEYAQRLGDRKRADIEDHLVGRDAADRHGFGTRRVRERTRDDRIDRQHDLRAALEYDVDRSLTIAPAIAWTRNASSVAPSDFRRTQAFVYARYRF
jgi:hypothetical protein